MQNFLTDIYDKFFQLFSNYDELIGKGKIYEQLILERSGLMPKREIKTFDCTVPPLLKYQSQNIRTMQFHSQNLAQKDDKKTLVCLHGYGGTGASFYRMIKHLIPYYNIYCIDLPGMGLSTRVNFDETDHNQMIDYFISTIESWRNIQNIDKFTLIGHSFGGYLSGIYALKYPERLDKLILISPLGVTKRSQKEDEEREQSYITKFTSYKAKLLFQFVKYLIMNKVTYSDIYQSKFLPSQYFLDRYMQYWFPDNELEKNLWFYYLDNVWKLPSSSEKCLYYMFTLPLFSAKYPLEELFKKNQLKVPVYFYFGDRDWMCQIGAKNLAENQILNVPCKFQIIKNSGHNVTFDNPKDLCDAILINNNN